MLYNVDIFLLLKTKKWIFKMFKNRRYSLHKTLISENKVLTLQSQLKMNMQFGKQFYIKTSSLAFQNLNYKFQNIHNQHNKRVIFVRKPPSLN